MSALTTYNGTRDTVFGTGVHALSPATPGSVEVRTVFGRYAASVGALCAMVDGSPVGLIATSLAVGISYDPPMITFSIRKESTTWPRLATAPRIGVSVLGSNQEELCWKLAGPEAKRFSDLDTLESDKGAVFLPGAMSWFDCEKVTEFEAGDHEIVVLQLIEVGHDSEAEPLIFLDGKFRALEALKTT